MKNCAYALFLILALAGCTGGKPPQRLPLPVNVQDVAALTEAFADAGNRYTAVLAPRQLVNLAFKVPGYVDFLDPKAMDKGARVAKGQQLARLNEADYKAKVDQAQAALQEARAAQVQAQRDQERYATLLQGSVISRGEYERYQQQRQATQARADQAQAQLEQARLNLRDATLVSPMDAVVVRRDMDRGALAAQGSVVYVLADLSSVKAVFGLPGQDVARVRLGQSLPVAVSAWEGREFSGSVTAISPSADPKSRTFEVEITIPNPDGALLDGMVASVALGSSGPGLDAQGGGTACAVPLQALARPAASGGQGAFVAYVLTQRDGRTYARERTVHVARIEADMAVTVSGVSPGEQIITRGATLAADGQEVRIIR